MRRSTVIATLILACAAFVAKADETCNSPYMTKLIKGQEDYVYVWTLGVEGLGDGSDKLVTVDVNPKSKRYGKVIHSVSIGARVEAHHMGFTDDRRHIWAGGLADNRIWVFDIASDPEGDEADQGVQRAGRAARDPLVAQSQGQLGDHRRRAHLEALAGEAGRQGMVAKEVGTIGDPAKIPLPVDISITRDGKGLWVNTFMDGKTRYFDLSNPEAPKQTYEKVTGKQVNMVSQSWDGKRLYITSSLLANWDKGGDDNEQFLRGFAWDGKALAQKFEIDFTKEKLGRAHHMKLGSRAVNEPAKAK